MPEKLSAMGKRLREAWSDPALQVAFAEPDGQISPAAAFAAYEVCVALGDCLLYGDPDPVAAKHLLSESAARAAAKVFCRRLTEWTTQMNQLGEIFDRSEPFINVFRCTEAIDFRMDAWAAYLVLDDVVRAKQKKSDRPVEVAWFDQVLDALEAFDEAAQSEENLRLLSIVCDWPFLDNLRSKLAKPYNEILPWWLDSLLERIAQQIAEQTAPGSVPTPVGEATAPLVVQTTTPAQQSAPAAGWSRAASNPLGILLGGVVVAAVILIAVAVSFFYPTTPGGIVQDDHRHTPGDIANNPPNVDPRPPVSKESDFEMVADAGAIIERKTPQIGTLGQAPKESILLAREKFRLQPNFEKLGIVRQEHAWVLEVFQSAKLLDGGDQNDPVGVDYVTPDNSQVPTELASNFVILAVITSDHAPQSFTAAGDSPLKGEEVVELLQKMTGQDKGAVIAQLKAAVSGAFAGRPYTLRGFLFSYSR